ncbi:PREDICTED: uncharacterized protein LOC108358437 isoform X3 [Rhagoletis zephyria]|uniref:uncharacterized protein LOC108358437 isoform X3 n=1 Tax=Rhagoletis zephyria TaxID=28612 RepID=UPI0008117989|nr:PREDICTED: uncharacterized protein LOC108358437 isoform X3 [Rhagoletis zephyria]
MGRIKQFDLYNYISYDAKRNVSVCVLCEKALAGKRLCNIKRHYLTVHGQQFPDNESSGDVNEASTLASTSVAIARKEPSNRLTISMDKSDFITCCVGLVTVKRLPFGIFDDEKYFRKLMRPYEDQFKIKVDSKNIADEVNTLGNKTKQNIAQAVHKKMISLKFDFTSRMGQNILVVHIQYMSDSNLEICTIGVISLERECTSNFLREEIANYLTEFNVDTAQVYACVSDNGANFKVVMNSHANEAAKICQPGEESNGDDEYYLEVHTALQDGFETTRCFAHTIQLVSQDVMEAIEPQVDECRRVIEFLRKTHPNLQILVLDFDSSWISTFDMLNNLHSLKSCIQVESITDSVVPEVDWHFLSTYLEAFKPLWNCTSKLQSEQYIVGDFYRDLMCCELELDELMQKGNFYAQLLVEALKNRKEELLKSEAFLAALYVDPRFNFIGSPFLNDDNKQIAVKHLLKTYGTIESFTTTVVDDKSNAYVVPQQMTTDSSGPYLKLEQKMSLLIEKSYKSDITMEEKLTSFCVAERLPFEANILEYWRSKKYKDLELGKLVDAVLSIPTTQYSAGRALKALSMISENRQQSLSKDTLKNLLLINLNNTLV